MNREKSPYFGILARKYVEEMMARLASHCLVTVTVRINSAKTISKH